MTLPLPLQLSTHIPGLEGDAYVHLWTFDWAFRAVRSGHFDLRTTDLFYPYGVSLLQHNIAWANIGVWALLRPILGGVSAYSLAILLIPPFNGYAVFLLVREVLGEGATDRADSKAAVTHAALTAGAIGLAWPAVVSQLNHPNLIVVGFLSLALKYLVRLTREGRTRDLWLGGLCLGLAGFVRVQMLLLAVALIAPVVVAQMVSRGHAWNWRLWRKIVVSGLVALPLSLVVALPLIVHFVGEGNMADLGGSSLEHPGQSALAYVLPNTRHPLWGAAARQIAAEVFSVDAPFYVAAVGYSVLVLSFVALVHPGRGGARRRTWGWATTAFTLFFLSLGPLAWRPYATLYQRLLLPILREPERFGVLLSVPLSVLAGQGLYWLIHRLPQVRQRRVTLATIAIVCLEFTIYPCPGQPVATPKWYESLAQTSESYGILDVPMYRQHSESYMLYQLTHRKPLVYGHVSRPPDDAFAFIDTVPLLAHLRHEVSSTPPRPPVSISDQMVLLDAANIRYVILHRSRLRPDELRAWRHWLVVDPIHEDDDLVVYDTSQSLWRTGFGDRPELSPGLQAIQSSTDPATTMPGGWVSATVHWFVAGGSSEADDCVCLIWIDSDGAVQGQACDLPIYAGDRKTTGPPGLVESPYLVQVPPSAPEGQYTLAAIPCVEGSPEAGALPVTLPGSALSVQARDRDTMPPTPPSPLDVVFAGEVALVGYGFVPDAPGGAHLDLYWEARRQPSASYKVFVHVLDVETGQVQLQQDFVPLDWAYPTDLWQAGEYVQDRVVLDLTTLHDGEYRILAGWYDPATGARLTTTPAYPDEAVPLVDPLALARPE